MLSKEDLPDENKYLRRDIKELNNMLSIFAEAINKLGARPEFEEAHKYLMSEIPTVECP